MTELKYVNDISAKCYAILTILDEEQTELIPLLLRALPAHT